MQITVLVEKANGTGFRASCGEPFHLSAEAETRAEVLQKLKAEFDARLTGGAEVVTMEVGVPVHPALEMAGILKGHPLLDEWKRAMAEYRDQVEKDDDYR
jgi:hypothetical protein